VKELQERHPAHSRLSAYLELTKPRIMLLVLLTTSFSFYLGGKGIPSFALLGWTLLGTALVKGGAATLNHFLERDTDARMERTSSRPIPAGIIPPQNALSFGLLQVLAGVIILVNYVNLLTAFLGLLSAFLYVLVYTPLKRLTWLNTSIGAIPGALPAMGGWTAATGHLDPGAWVIFGILFFWQHPHFYAIAVMCREDYARAGFKMIPVLDTDGHRTTRHILWHAFFLIPVSLLPYFLHITGHLYLVGVALLGLAYFSVGWALRRDFTTVRAQWLLRASLIYFPSLLILTLMDTRL
jgi:protoheme IX farnesyltransferase